MPPGPHLFPSLLSCSSNAAGAEPTLATVPVLSSRGCNITRPNLHRLTMYFEILRLTPRTSSLVRKEALRRLPAESEIPCLITRQAVCSFISLGLHCVICEHGGTLTVTLKFMLLQLDEVPGRERRGEFHVRWKWTRKVSSRTVQSR